MTGIALFAVTSLVLIVLAVTGIAILFDFYLVGIFRVTGFAIHLLVASQ